MSALGGAESAVLEEPPERSLFAFLNNEALPVRNLDACTTERRGSGDAQPRREGLRVFVSWKPRELKERLIPRNARHPSIVQSVVRSFDLLEAVAAEDEIGLVELAHRTRLQPSTTHRLLATLIECGYVVQNPQTSRYRLSHKVVELAGGPEHRIERLRTSVRPHLVAIRDATEETTNLCVLDRFTVVYVDQAESGHAVRMLTEIGRRVPAHACGAGKVMLAHQSPEQIALLAAREPFEPLTPHTLTTAKALATELRRARECGFAIDREEFEDGVACVAAPIFGPGAEVLGAISVSGPAARLMRGDLAELGDLVLAHVHAISRELGHQPSDARTPVAT